MKYSISNLAQKIKDSDLTSFENLNTEFEDRTVVVDGHIFIDYDYDESVNSHKLTGMDVEISKAHINFEDRTESFMEIEEIEKEIESLYN